MSKFKPIPVYILRKLSTEDLLKLIPRKTHNCEPFGLMLMVTGDWEWTCTYYTHYSKKSDDRFPVIKAASINGAIIKMYRWMAKNMPDSLKKQHEITKTKRT